MNQPAANDVSIAEQAIEELRSAGLSGAEASQWRQAQPHLLGDFGGDAAASSRFFAASRALLGKLPAKPKRSEREARAAQSLLSGARAAREAFLARHAAEVYSELTTGRSRFVRVEDLPYAAARLIDGLTPTREEVAAEARLLQGDKDGVEIDQGIFLAHVLADKES